MSDTLTMPPPPAPPAATAPVPPRPRPVIVYPKTPPCPVGFFLFIVLNFVLFVRPTEIVHALLGLELYLVVILLCLATAFPVVLDQLRPARLEREPLTMCVLCVCVAVVLSLLAGMQLGRAWTTGFDFFKMVLYVLLLRGLVTTPARLRTFLLWLGVFIVVSTAVTLLDFHGYIALPATTRLKDGDFVRLRGSGIFQDPNDLCILVALGVQISLYGLTDSRLGLARVFWLGALAVLFRALLLTQSRGGLLAVLAGLGLMFRARFGWGRSLLLGAACLPPLLLAVGGRQGDLSTNTETGQARVQLWSDALAEFRRSPLVGVGAARVEDIIGQVAHNSYLQAFSELGLLGGACFAGAFLYALLNLYRLSRDLHRLDDAEWRRVQPFLLGALGSWMVGMASLSLTYLLPTYTMLTLAAIVIREGRAEPPLPQARFDLPFVWWLLKASGLFVVGLYLFVRLTVIR